MSSSAIRRVLRSRKGASRLASEAALIAASLAVLAIPAQARSGGISLSAAWSRATAPRAEIGAGFLTIRNTAARTDRLLSAASPKATRVEIHTMTLSGGVMRMRPLANGLEVPSGSTLALAPGGNHFMFIGLKSPMKVGERVDATLQFQRAGTVRVTFTVGGPGASGPMRGDQ